SRVLLLLMAGRLQRLRRIGLRSSGRTEGESPWGWIVWRTEDPRGSLANGHSPRSRWAGPKILQVVAIYCVVTATVQMIRATGKCLNPALRGSLLFAPDERGGGHRAMVPADV